MDHAETAEALCRVCRLFGERQWCLATSGNFSARVGRDEFLITESGKDKSRLTPEDLLASDLRGDALDASRKPSAETPLMDDTTGIANGSSGVTPAPSRQWKPPPSTGMVA